MNKLKPCRFCGAEPKTEVYCGDNSKRIYFRIYCSKCERVEQKTNAISSSVLERILDTIDEVCEAWNRRANDEADC